MAGATQTNPAARVAAVTTNDFTVVIWFLKGMQILSFCEVSLLRLKDQNCRRLLFSGGGRHV